MDSFGSKYCHHHWRYTSMNTMWSIIHAGPSRMRWRIHRQSFCQRVSYCQELNAFNILAPSGLSGRKVIHNSGELGIAGGVNSCIASSKESDRERAPHSGREISCSSTSHPNRRYTPESSQMNRLWALNREQSHRHRTTIFSFKNHNCGPHYVVLRRTKFWACGQTQTGIAIWVGKRRTDHTCCRECTANLQSLGPFFLSFFSFLFVHLHFVFPPFSSSIRTLSPSLHEAYWPTFAFTHNGNRLGCLFDTWSCTSSRVLKGHYLPPKSFHPT
jgi:hypothetical protein